MNVRPIVIAVALGSSACIADADDVSGNAEDVATTFAALQTAPPSAPAEAPILLQETRRSWMPAWAVYELPRRTDRDARVVAVPVDARGGVPVVLWFGHYHYSGGAYFAQILRSGYVSALDLKIIGDELEAGHVGHLDQAPKDAVDPFTQRIALPDGKRARTREGDGPVSYPGDIGIEDHAGEGGPGPVVPTIVPTTPPTGPGVYHCSGKRVDGPAGCTDYDTNVSGATKLARAIRSWLPSEAGIRALFATKTNCQYTCVAPVTITGSLDLACNVIPILRAVPNTATACATFDVATKGFGILGTWCMLWCDQLFQEVP